MDIMYWDKSYDVGVARFNDHHKEILRIRNELVKLVTLQLPPKEFRELFFDLINYTSKHFKAEEEMMEVTQYPDIESHKKEHKILVKKLITLIKQFAKPNVNSKELVRFVTDWIYTHINQIDKRYKPFFSKILDKESLARESKIFEIPEIKFITWKIEYDVGQETFNEHHKELINLQNQMVNLINLNTPPLELQGLLSKLIKYADRHFQAEEAEMKRVDFPGLKNHHEEHNKFVVDIFNMCTELNKPFFKSETLLQFINTWIVEHILISDMKYKDYFSGGTEGLGHCDDKSVFDHFKLVDALCPSCGTNVKCMQIPPRLYSEIEHDVDRYPKKRQWNNKVKKTVNPLLYYFHLCPKCSFTASDEYFENPVKGCQITQNKFNHVIHETLQKNPTFQNLTEPLKQDINPNHMNHFSAIKLNLLALFQLYLVPDIFEKDALSAAKYSLRLAWLFRELKEIDALSDNERLSLKSILNTVSEVWSRAPINERKALELASALYETTLSKSYMIETNKDSVNFMIMIARINIMLHDRIVARKMLFACRDEIKDYERKIKDGKIEKQDNTTTSINRMKMMLEDIQADYEDMLYE